MTRHSILAALFGLMLTILSTAQAADAPANDNETVNNAKPAIEVISVVIHPTAEPMPALKYHLLPTFLERTPGDAMPLYTKALVRHVEVWRIMADEAPSDKESPSDLDHCEEWLETPLDKLPRDRVKKLVDAFGGSVRSQLDLAVRREHCNWDAPVREGHVFEILLPEVQEFRNLARIVALRARLQIAEGKFAGAIASLQTGYGMARQVAEQPFLVGSLVGATIAQKMGYQLLTLCQQPGAPNLYWCIAELPSPWIDRRKAIEAEYDGLYLQWPELKTLRHAQYVPEQWNLVLRKVVSDMVRFDYEGDRSRARMSDKELVAKIEEMIARALDRALGAKADLIAAGYSQKELDAMPPAQLALLQSLDAYDRARDKLFKWWQLPYWQAREGLDAANRELASVAKKEAIPMATLLQPSISSALLFSFAHTDRQLAVIRCIEALRLYAAAHDGKLPATLDEIKEVPIPLNPITGKPFPYRLEGKTAVLDADGGLTNTPRPQYRVSVVQ
jgi:hypothetical protein